MADYKDKLITINLELRDAQKKEEELLFADPAWKKAVGKSTAPLRTMLEDKIPEKLEDTLNAAFTAAFKAVFQEGKILIKKTYDADALRKEYAQKRSGAQTKADRFLLKQLRKPGEKRHLKAMGFATAEGAGLGLLGIGLPDIPLLIASMIRTCMVSAQSYGIDTDRQDEQVYMLRLIRLAAMSPEERREDKRVLDTLGDAIDQGEELTFNLEEEMKATSEKLSTALLFSRFVMGLPVVGVAGGMYNPLIVSKLHQLAELKYECRMLKRVKANILRQYHNS